MLVTTCYDSTYVQSIVTTYDLRLPSWDPPTTTNNHQQPHSIRKKCHIDYQRRQPIQYFTTKHTPAPLGLCVLGDVRSPPPPVSLSSQPIVTTYDLRLTTYNLRPMTSQLCFTGTHPPPVVSQFNISLRSQPANTYYSIRISTKKADIPTHQHQPPPAVSQFNISLRSQPTLTTLSEYPLRKQTTPTPTPAVSQFNLSQQPASQHFIH